jgi:hypothetical protein
MREIIELKTEEAKAVAGGAVAVGPFKPVLGPGPAKPRPIGDGPGWRLAAAKR